MHHPGSSLSRRDLLIAGTLALPGLRTAPLRAQTPAATPDVDQVALFRDLDRQVRERGRNAAGLFLDGEDDAFAAHLTPDLAELFAGVSASEYVEILETNRVFLHLGRIGAWFDGHYDGSDTMTGFFVQGLATGFTVMANEPQGGNVPTGRWVGEIGPGTIGLECAITFSGTADALEATLDIPSQRLLGVPFAAATFSPSRPVGDLTDEQGLPTSLEQGLYRVGYQWDPFELVLSIFVDRDGTVSGFTTIPNLSLPTDPLAGYVSEVTYRLPVDGQLFVGWGGDTVFRNYHAASPPQRHAYDFAIWRDGATHDGDGRSNEDYHVWGRPVVAPAAGVVVAVENAFPDIEPLGVTAVPGSALVNAPHPEGNHIVIQTAQREFLHLAHLQEGSIRVGVGQQVAAGDGIAQVGNSGNSSEPHIHIHVQNVPDGLSPAARGVPLAFSNYLHSGQSVGRGSPLQGQFVEQLPGS